MAMFRAASATWKPRPHQPSRPAGEQSTCSLGDRRAQAFGTSTAVRLNATWLVMSLIAGRALTPYRNQLSTS